MICHDLHLHLASHCHIPLLAWSEEKAAWITCTWVVQWLFTSCHHWSPTWISTARSKWAAKSCLGSLGALLNHVLWEDPSKPLILQLETSWKFYDPLSMITYRFHQIFLQYRETCVPLQDLPACLGWRCASWSASISCSILTYLDDSAHPSCSIMRFWSFPLPAACWIEKYVFHVNWREIGQPPGEVPFRQEEHAIAWEQIRHN